MYIYILELNNRLKLSLSIGHNYNVLCNSTRYLGKYSGSNQNHHSVCKINYFVIYKCGIICVL